MTLEIRVPVESGDVELFGGDPYRSARSWHDEAVRLQGEIHRLAHLVIVHGSDPATMFGRWAEDASCCPRTGKGG